MKSMDKEALYCKLKGWVIELAEILDIEDPDIINVDDISMESKRFNFKEKIYKMRISWQKKNWTEADLKDEAKCILDAEAFTQLYFNSTMKCTTFPIKPVDDDVLNAKIEKIRELNNEYHLIDDASLEKAFETMLLSQYITTPFIEDDASDDKMEKLRELNNKHHLLDDEFFEKSPRQ